MQDQAPSPSAELASGVTVDVTRRGDHTIVHVAGEVDLSCVATLRRRLNALVVDGDVRLVVELSGVTFMDSAGLASLVGVYKQVRMFRGSLVLAAPSKQVRRILEITALDRVFTVAASVDEAVAL